MNLLVVIARIAKNIRVLLLIALTSLIFGCGGSSCPTETATPYVWFVAPVEGNPDKLWVQFRTRYISSCSSSAANYSDSNKLRRTSANNEANYSVAGRTIQRASFYRNLNGVLLTISSNLVAGSAVNVTVKDLVDESGGVMTNTPKTFSITYRNAATNRNVFADYYVYTGGFGSGLASEMVGNIDYGWGSGNVGGSGRSDNVAVRWTAYVQLGGVGNYAFQTRTDDGVRFRAIDMSNGNWLIDDWVDQGATDNNTQTFALTSGYENARIPILMEYYESSCILCSSNAEARLRWSTPSSGFTAIPASSFFTGMALPAELPAYSVQISDVVTSASVCSGTGSTMKITVLNEDGDVITGFAGTVNLTTSTGRGDWAISSASGTLNNGTANDGAATYTFIAADNGVATLRLTTRHADTLTATATVASTTVTKTSPSITFADNAFVLSPNVTYASDYIAGRAHEIEIQQVQKGSGGTCEVNTAYTGTKALRFWYANENGTWLAPKVGTVTLGTVKPGTATHSVSFTAGRATVSFLSADAGQFMLSVVDDGTYRSGNATNEIAGSLSSMIVRPFGLRVRYGTAATSLQSVRSTTANAAQAVFAKAGDEFTARVEAVAWEAVDDTNGDGIPDGHADDDPNNNADLAGNALTTKMADVVTLSRGYAQSGAAGTALTTVTGITAVSWAAGAANARVYYDDVGEIEIRAEGSFLGRAVKGRSGYAGRFAADRFDIQTVSGYGTLAHGHGTCSYTYRGESFGYLLPPRIIVTAKTSRNTTAASYAGVYWKLPSVPVTSLTAAEATAATLNRTAPASSYVYSGIAAGAGTLILSGDTFVIPKRNLVFTQNAGDEVLSPSIQITLSAAALTESTGAGDTACYRGNTTSCQPYTLTTAATGTQVRDGCLQLTSASTVGRNPVTIPMAVVYYSGGRYITNTNETAACLTLPAPTASNHTGSVTSSNLQSLTLGTLAAGVANITATLSASAPVNPVGSATVTLNAPAYLECRDTGAAAQDPVATASWQSGVTNPVLRMQETWR